MKQLLHHKWPIMGLTLINVVLRTVWLVHVHPRQISDFAYYYEHAVSILHGHGYSTNGHFTDYFPMGYIFFLAALFFFTGPTVLAGMVANAIFSLGIVVCIYILTVKITKVRWAAFASGLLYTLLPSQIAWNSITGTEELFTFLLIVSIVLYSYKWTKWSGVVMGIACIVRPILLIYPLFLFLYEWKLKKTNFKPSLRKIGIYTVLMFLAICPATIRNYIGSHHFVLVSTNGGVNLWQGTNTNTGYFWSNDPTVNPLLAAGSNDFLRDQLGKRAFESYVFHHPIVVFLNGWTKIWYLYKEDTGPYAWFNLVRANGWTWHAVGIWRLVSNTGYLVLIYLAFLGLILSLFRRYSNLPLVFILYNTMIFFFFPAWDRFRYPIMPFWSVYAGIAVYLVYQLSRKITGQRRQDVFRDATS